MSDLILFNSEKSDYEKPTLFLGDPMGLLDTVNDPHPRLWELYRALRSLDWDTNEFDFAPCKVEFKTKDPKVAQGLIQNLGWQWEGDSLAANSIMATMGHFVTNSALKAVWDQVVANENLHWTTYSEVVRFSFDEPNAVLKEVLAVKEGLQRMETIARVMSNAYRTGLKLSLGLLKRDDPEVYAAAFLFTVGLFIFERVHFMGSFAVTGAIAQTGDYMPICNAIQRIAQDEAEVHVNVDKYVIETELATPRGLQCWRDHRDVIFNMLQEATASEMRWINFQRDSGSVVPNVGWEDLKAYVKFNSADAHDTLRLKTEFKAPTAIPLPYMVKWLDVSRRQASPQEQDNGQYRVGVIRRDDVGLTLPFARAR